MPPRAEKADAPRAAQDPRRWGALVLAALLLLGLTGLPLALVYAPDPARAHDAVAALAQGRLAPARAVHAWAASAAVALVAIHMGAAIARERYHAAGRRVAVAGLLALALLLTLLFTGTILPWDQRGWEAFVHLRTGAAAAGIPLAEPDPQAAPLGLLFYAHVLVLPALLLGLVAWHVRRGSGARLALRRLWLLARSTWRPALALVAALLLLAPLAPPPLGPAPLPGLSLTRPEWPFLWLVPLQDAFGARGLLALPLALAAGVAWAALDRRSSTRARAWGVGIVAATWGLLTLLALR